MFKKVLVANRGEIALRVLRACREMGIASVAVYSEADRLAPHVRYADEAYCLGGPLPADSYLRIDRLLEVAKKSGAEAVHPGYGFLAERPDFAAACEDAGLIFIGPNSRAMAMLGSKTEARRTMLAAGVPVIPGMDHGCGDVEEGLAFAREVGFPVMLKAAAGGGGKGMRTVDNEDDFAGAFTQAKAEAGSSFGDDTVFVEKQIVGPRHIEFQILCDNHGNAVHLNERECSIQRRHQKLVEESPSAIMTPELRERMGAVAVKAALASGYTNAGTVEFLVDRDLNFYFLEVNARLQVEHPVTEMVTGIDLVKAQFAVSAGEKLWFTQDDVRLNGSAIECRICAEDPYEGFFPSSGLVELLMEPAGPGVRLESGLREGQEVSLYYDPLVAKLIVWGADRTEAIERTRRALSEYEIYGIKTTIPFHRQVMTDEGFVGGDFDTGYVDNRRLDEVPKRPGAAAVAAVAAALLAEQGGGPMAQRPGVLVAAGVGAAGSQEGNVSRQNGRIDPWLSGVYGDMRRRNYGW
ncbi:MAG: acetyl-CoA carboxylase biotin carboxylase subunit [Actinobacteria bacterium]|nr:acetyl-CoA carboxylase biotin carboxylase subunit [Actinomycetota bacterium]